MRYAIRLGEHRGRGGIVSAAEKHDLASLGASVAANLGDGPEPSRRAVQRHTLVEKASRRSREWSRVPLRSLVMVTCGAVLALVLVVQMVATDRTPLDFWVGNDTIAAREGASLMALSAEPLPVRFSEGTRLTLEAGGRADVTKASRRKAHVTLHDGRLGAHVNPGTGVAWTFDAGPYVVAVKGTAFRVDWQPIAQAMTVDLFRGRVEVRGPHLPTNGLVLETGQRLEVTRTSARVVALAVSTAPSEPNSDDPVPEPTSQPTPEPSVLSTASSTSAQAGPLRSTARHGMGTDETGDWRKLVQQGSYSEALARAQKQGVPRLVETLSLADLTLLGDAARYARSAPEARLALDAIERRFPSSRQARLAPFLLGRLALDVESNPKEAARQFRRYINRNPNGQLVEEAHGRLILALNRSNDRDGARAAANTYLARFPEGPNAALARSVAEGH